MVTVAQLIDELGTMEPDSPVILRDPSHYPDTHLPEDYVSLEIVLFQMGMFPQD